MGKESTCNAGDTGSIPTLGRSPGEEHGKEVQYSCLENSMDRGAWLATVPGVARFTGDLALKPPPPWIPELRCEGSVVWCTSLEVAAHVALLVPVCVQS